MKEGRGLHPWLNIWFWPRKAIRSVIATDVTYQIVVIFAMYGFQFLLQIFQYLSCGVQTSLSSIVLVAVILSLPVGYLILNGWSLFYFWTGKLIGGRATFKEVRFATCWSSVPLACTCLIWCVLMAVDGNALFVVGHARQSVGVATWCSVIFGVWQLVLLLSTLKEVQRLSIGLALVNFLLAKLAIFIVLFFGAWVVASMIAIA